MSETPQARMMILGFYAILLALGITFYWVWSFLYGTWTDLGVYSLTVVMVGFGLVGTLLYTIKPLEDEEE